MPSIALPISKPSHHSVSFLNASSGSSNTGAGAGASGTGNGASLGLAGSLNSNLAASFGLSPQSWGNSFSGQAWLKDALPSISAIDRSFEEDSSSYLNRLEEAFCRDFNCCGKNLGDLHELIHHYEEQHAVLSSEPSSSSDASSPSVENSSIALNSSHDDVPALRKLDRICMHNLEGNMSMDTSENSAVMPFVFPTNDASNNAYRVSVVVPASAAAAVNASSAEMNDLGMPGIDPSNLSDGLTIDTAPPMGDMNLAVDMSGPNSPFHGKRDMSTFLPPFPADQDIFSFPSPAPDMRTQSASTRESSMERSPSVASQTSIPPAYHNEPAVRPLEVKDRAYTKKLRHSSHVPMTIDSPGSNLVVVDKPYKCPVEGCDKAYKNQNGLKYHKLHGHCSPITTPTPTPVPMQGFVVENKPYRCELCNKRYKNLNGLKYHRSHSHLQVSVAQTQRDVQMNYMRQDRGQDRLS
ncbi:transcription factor Sfp1 [Schizosaccharomyces japonicus yFS275]|uniref:Transcription factor Sfp1 n=1 Tax=Schizosaccharomyces japonicus (strain yFS275 / FY16936) TaxID=402676 RepID=B6K3Q1_SCHJY|nr:transcription factor Sfp1 [Schizosaccharomyces japonicus yFS275]EEB08108.1 transcription factor Sfp1 [Schizosaccharomyces japonicus yFS275]